jgi:peptidyl-prolyl cis-trans isomerase C
MSAPMTEVTVNGVAIDIAAWPSPELAAVRELLRQRAVSLALIAADASGEAVDAAIERLIEREVTMPEPSVEECRRYYEANRARFRSGDLVGVRHILFQITPGSPVNMVRAWAERMLAQLLAAPEDFEACAAEASNCPSARQGGNLGQIGRGDTVPEFEAALFADVSTGILPRLVSTRYGFHIVRIDRRVPGEMLPFELVRERIAALLSEQVQKSALRQYVALLAGQAELRGVELGAASSPLVQ